MAGACYIKDIKKDSRLAILIIMKSCKHDEIQNKFWMKYFSCEKYEIKFAFNIYEVNISYASAYFITKWFHSPQANFIEKRQVYHSFARSAILFAAGNTVCAKHNTVCDLSQLRFVSVLQTTMFSLRSKWCLQLKLQNDVVSCGQFRCHWKITKKLFSTHFLFFAYIHKTV